MEITINILDLACWVVTVACLWAIYKINKKEGENGKTDKRK